MQGIDLIQDFGVLLLAAGISGIVCRRLGLSVIVGYLLAGILIGPYTPPFSLIADEARIMALSQVGLVFLMFAIGLGLSLSRFARMGAEEFASWLRKTAARMDWRRYQKSKRAPKKPVKLEAQFGAHCSTARLLAQRKNQ